MKMKKNRISGILLSLTLMLGIMAGMCVTVMADNTIFNPATTYTGFGELNTNNTVVTISEAAGYTWYVIANDSSTVTLLSREGFGNQKFNNSPKGNAYDNSDIKQYVDGLTGTGQPLAGISSALSAGPTLIDTTTAEGLSNVKKTGSFPRDWWLSSPASAPEFGMVYLVYNNSGNFEVGTSSATGSAYLVRPALMLDLSKVVFSSESNTFSLIYSVNLTGGAKAGSSGGSLRQEVAAGNAMETVTFTAGTGYQFPITSDLYTTTGGITVERTSDTVVTVSGTPTDIEVNVTVPDAEAKTYALTLDNQGATKPGANSVTATYDAVLPSIADNLPSRTGYTFDGYFSEKNGGGKQYLKADGTPTEEKWTKDDGGTLYAGWTQKPEANVKEAPKAKDLTYNGKAQELVTEGEAEGGTMQYAVGKDASTAPTDGWSEKIPTGTEAGTYYVWYKVMGDGNHTDTAASSVSVTIAEEDKPDEPEREAGKPVLIKATSDAISVKTEEGMEYSVDGGNNWNATGIFTDLQPDTEYSIIARYAANGGKEAGKPSEGLTVRTLKIVEKTVSTKTINVSGKEIKVVRFFHRKRVPTERLIPWDRWRSPMMSLFHFSTVSVKRSRKE